MSIKDSFSINGQLFLKLLQQTVYAKITWNKFHRVNLYFEHLLAAIAVPLAVVGRFAPLLVA
jgi:hypothetical protein